MTELAHRRSNGLDVALLWSRRTGRLVVAVSDDRTDESFSLDAPRDHARLEAEVRHVVLHELAHHFGISDERLIEIDRY